MPDLLRRPAHVLAVLSAALATGLVVATPPAQSQAVEPSLGASERGTYVVVHDDQRLTAVESRREARELVAAHGGEIERHYGHSLDGFAAELSLAEAAAIAADPAVDHVEPVHRLHAQDVDPGPGNWGDDRVDQRDLPLSGTFEYPADAGRNAHVYVVDTGINASHQEFAGRVGVGIDLVDNDGSPSDCNGHGTHVSGTAVGSRYGVARLATVHAVRVLDCLGEGFTDDLIAGLDWIRANASRPAVVNLSLGCDQPCVTPAVDTSVANLIASGIPVVQSAGNTHTDACLYRPSQAAGTITVGASTISDSVADFSNYGGCVDIWAPGAGIVSADDTGVDAAVSYSGTSMAAPHVTGAAALYLSANPSAPSAQVWNAIIANATVGRLSGLDASSPNRLLFTGFLLPQDPVPPPPPPGCGTRTNGRDLRIRDFRTTTSRMTRSCAGTGSARSRVTVRIAHTAIGNLRVSLVAPDGSRSVLHRRTGGSIANLNRTYVLDLSEERAGGTWRLLVNDNKRRDQGRLKSWTLAL